MTLLRQIYRPTVSDSIHLNPRLIIYTLIRRPSLHSCLSLFMLSKRIRQFVLHHVGGLIVTKLTPAPPFQGDDDIANSLHARGGAGRGSDGGGRTLNRHPPDESLL